MFSIQNLFTFSGSSISSIFLIWDDLYVLYNLHSYLCKEKIGDGTANPSPKQAILQSVWLLPNQLINM